VIRERSMLKDTLIIVGPGGVGKGPLGDLLRDDAVVIDPYRLRKDGPRRESDDSLYAPPRLRNELCSVLAALGDSPRSIPCQGEEMIWYPRGKVLFFTVRGEWQCLILQGLDGEIAKAELYAPVLPAILGIADIGQSLGTSHIMVLNPSPAPLCAMSDWHDLQARTRENCSRRGDREQSVDRRVGTITTEAPAWRRLATDWNACELTNWPFPEYRYQREDRRHLLREARATILERSRQLKIFFKKEHEI
jgi:hypothetical protein